MSFMHAATRRTGHALLAMAALWLGTGSNGFAADSTTEVAAGGLTYAGQQTLVTREEEIVISADRVRATYTLLNAAPEPRKMLMAFGLPDLDMMALDGSNVDNTAYDPLNPLNFIGFAALIDGQPADTYVESRALSLGLVDATATLRELALPLYPLHSDLPIKLAALPEAAKADLLARSLIRVSDGLFEPQWTLKTTLFWQQPFAAGQTHKIAISYRPISGSSLWTPETAAALQERYCVPEVAAAELNKRAGGADPATVKWVHFLAHAGAVARGSINKYRMAIETAYSKQSAHTCRSGLNATTEAGSRDSVQTDIIAEDEVHVLFVE